MADDVAPAPMPLPGPDVRVKTGLWAAERAIHRIHSRRFSALQFNPGFGSARFSPLLNPAGDAVPTLYGGESIDVALMETLFHDLPYHSNSMPFDMAKIAGLVYSRLVPLHPLTFVALTPMTLRRLGVRRQQLLDSEASDYVFTRYWAQALWRDNPQAHGICWSSRQHGGQALMLFGDRVTAQGLRVEIASSSLIASDVLLDNIEKLADEMGVVLLPPGGGAFNQGR
ncbi:RES family NAD+ phosphorylase [Enterobacteriaceae bacterium 4M9]|nr:RES family NAD+ phosphorylase [Enterobacteriaceae bacterium 4M9]